MSTPKQRFDKVQCKILDFAFVPNTNIQIVSMEFTLGKRVWRKGFRLSFDRPISMEEFKLELARHDIMPTEPEDFLTYVKEEADKPFELEIERDFTSK